MSASRHCAIAAPAVFAVGRRFTQPGRTAAAFIRQRRHAMLIFCRQHRGPPRRHAVMRQPIASQSRASPVRRQAAYAGDTPYEHAAIARCTCRAAEGRFTMEVYRHPNATPIDTAAGKSAASHTTAAEG